MQTVVEVESSSTPCTEKGAAKERDKEKDVRRTFKMLKEV